MKFTITRDEATMLIRDKFNFPSDVIIEIVDARETNDVSQESKSDVDGWVINTQTLSVVPDTLMLNDMIDVIFSDGDTATAIAGAWEIRWNVNSTNFIAKYRKTPIAK